ncbi:uncharacterized protein V6R79_003392 [Siganus canaliculatus]
MAAHSLCTTLQKTDTSGKTQNVNEHVHPSEAALKAFTHVRFKYHPPSSFLLPLYQAVQREGSGLNSVVIDYAIKPAQCISLRHSEAGLMRTSCVWVSMSGYLIPTFSSVLHWIQIKLSASAPTCPEGVTTHTVLSYEQTLLHAVGFTVAAKGQRREAWGGNPQRKCGTERCKKKVNSKQIYKKPQNRQFNSALAGVFMRVIFSEYIRQQNTTMDLQMVVSLDSYQVESCTQSPLFCRITGLYCTLFTVIYLHRTPTPPNSKQEEETKQNLKQKRPPIVQRSGSTDDDLPPLVKMDTFSNKLQQKALQQPKQKKSKSAEFLMGREERGIENPAFDGGGSTELSIPPVWQGREIRGDRPDSTLTAHPKKMELQAPAKERGNKRTQNYFDPLSGEQTDPRHRGMAGVSAEDELELTILNTDESKLYHRMAALLDEDESFINVPGTLLASRDEEVLEVKAGDPVLQRRLLLHGGGGGNASGSRPSQTHTIAKTQAGAGTGLEGGRGLEAVRMVMGRESNSKTRSAKEVIPHYAQQLRERVRPDMITLGSLSLQQQTTEKCPPKRSEWAKRKGRLMALFTGNVKEPHSQRDSGEQLREAPEPRLNTLLQCSTTVDSPSLRALGEGQEEVTTRYNHMTELPESSSPASRPQWQSTAPEPVEVFVCCLRAIRDKIPRGLYAVNVAIHSRLGGPALVLRSWKEQQQQGLSTEPVEHRGRYYDSDLHVNQSLITILPAAHVVIPSTVLVFQLIALPGHSSHVSSVLAWGAFPVCGSNLCHVQGRFKTPLLRGEPNTQLDQFKKIEALICSDLDHWLCNLYFQVRRLPAGPCGRSERCIPSNVPILLQDVYHEPSQGQMAFQHQLPSPLRPQSIQPQSQLYPQPQLNAGPSSRAGEPAVVHSHQGSPLHLSADSACSSSSLPGKNSSSGAISGTMGEKSDPCREKAEGGIHYKKKPIKKTNSCGPSMSGSSAPPRQAGKQKMQPSMENLSTEEMEEYTFSLQSAQTGPGFGTTRLSSRALLAFRMLPSELGLPLPRQQQPHSSWRGSVRQLGLIMPLLALMWFVRLYLHYCSQWLYLQAIAVPVNKFQFHAHTVDLVYQSSLLHTREELVMVVVGPLTLNTVTFLLVLIRWGCQQIFGSLPSFTSKFIMAQGVWTVLDPLAVFAVDAILGRLAYSPDTPVGDAAKLYWHFYRADQSGAAGVIITVFLYAVLFLLSITILFIYLLRFHNDGRMLDVFQRLTAKEGAYFLPQDLELSNQELSYIVKKAEQWRGFNGERRKVAVYDYIWTVDDPTVTPREPPREGAPPTEGETSTHVAIYTLYLSGLKQRYRHFLRQPDGAIIEVIGDLEVTGSTARTVPDQGQHSASQGEDKERVRAPCRQRKRIFGRE